MKAKRPSHVVLAWPVLFEAGVSRRSPTKLFSWTIRILAAAGCAFACANVRADDAAPTIPEEFRIKREAVYEFAARPTLKRDGDRVTIAFASKGLCDVTVAIEDADGRIVRHLASGVLGPNAPAPFAQNSHEQSLVWDGKDDQGIYVINQGRHVIRVSLGLDPKFERTLYWSPCKAIDGRAPIIRTSEDGVYVFQGCGVDSLRVYDHAGRYLRTVYPFPADKLAQCRGLRWHDFAQGYRLPLKESKYQQTLLTSGANASTAGMSGRAASAMAVGPAVGPDKSRPIAIASLKLDRLGSDGTTFGLPLTGPDVSRDVRLQGMNANHEDAFPVTPWSAAFSPDGRWVYLAGYCWRYSWHYDFLHGVLRVPFDGSGPPELFVGSLKQNDPGAKPGQFGGATSVAVDAAGRVYVADYMNDRVQVFSPEREFLKAISVRRPAQICLHPRTGELYVFSFLVHNRILARMSDDQREPEIQPSLTVLGPFDDPKAKGRWNLPLPPGRTRYNEWGWPSRIHGPIYWMELDGWADVPTIWIGRPVTQDLASAWSGRGHQAWLKDGIILLQLQGNNWVVKRDFGAETRREVTRARPTNNNIQKLHVDPRNGILYVGEPDSSPTDKAWVGLLRIDPEKPSYDEIELPFGAEDMALDNNGYLYLRYTAVVARYDAAALDPGGGSFQNFKEVPWDYGEEAKGVGSGSMFGKSNSVTGGLIMPNVHPVCFHEGGMSISPRGRLAVSCACRTDSEGRKEEKSVFRGNPYEPSLYPGRMVSSTSACLHVWDKHGRVLYDDAIPGMPQVDGVGIDRDDNLYVMATPTRMIGKERYFNRMTGTLMKFAPGKGRFLSPSPRIPVPLTGTGRPDRPMDLSGWWVEGAQWFYGGVGYEGFNADAPACACWHCRFTLDYFARSFAPEIDQYRVAVLDASGNLITHIGHYGNIDDGRPLVAAGGPAHPRSVGGDEVALFHACFVGTWTDRRLYIADFGNQRIVGVRLDYHAAERVDVPPP
ncbi:MAG: hypothetical protein BIFFINMI_02586 [Phycisphaerae bacterium]|nr:hypothetical protein [Phycisphaerae bacterium]